MERDKKSEVIWRVQSGTMKVSANEAIKQLGLEKLLPEPFNAWAAVTTFRHFPDFDEARFKKLYNINKSQAKALMELMYPQED